MANAPRKSNRSATGLSPPKSRVSPFVEIGASGVAVFGGRIISIEKNVSVAGRQRWLTYADMVANTSIIAAGVRYFLNVIASTKWTISPQEKDAQGEEKAAAEFVESVLNDMTTPWRRVMRRAAMYRFLGFGVQEWTAKRRTKDGKIGLDDIESRPSHTIDRWEVDEQGTVQGFWQLSPQTSQYLYLPRSKAVYLVEDSLTDSPEGLGLYRHLLEPFERLKKYLVLEGRGYERDLRGIPIGRVPYTAINAAVKGGSMTKEAGAQLTDAIERFVKTQSKTEDTSIVLDSIPYVVETDSGKSISGVMQYGLELLQGQSPDFGAMASAITRLNMEMARIIGVEHLLLGSESGSANRALSEDKSRNFYLTCNGTLDELSDGVDKDVIKTICDLNGIKEELRPKCTHSDVSFRSVQEITAALRDMSVAGAVLSPDDPVIEDVRDMLGVSPPPAPNLELIGALATARKPPPPPGMNGKGPPGDGKTPPAKDKADAAAAVPGAAQ